MRLVHLTALLSLLTPTAASGTDFRLTGTVTGFVCGDNCYLEISTIDDDEVVALCLAPQCGDWNQFGTLPPDMMGARVLVNVGAGFQYDSEGNLMDAFPAFTSIELQ